VSEGNRWAPATPVLGGPQPCDQLDLAARVLDKAERVLLVCHMSPDGDALGSMLAMMHFLTASSKEAVSTFPEPFVVPPQYRWLPGVDLLAPPETARELNADVAVTFDCASRDRTAELSDALDAASDIIVFDHHASNSGYGSVNLIFPDASSSSEIVYDFLAHIGAALSPDVATCLYVGIATDTGRFQYQNTSPRVFAICANLASVGLDIAGISRKVFEESRLPVLKLLALVVERAQLDKDAGAVYSWFDYRDLQRYGVHASETENYIDVLRQTSEADVAILVKELNPGVVKASIRSLGRVDVAQVAGLFGGGGHKMAAGFTSDRNVSETIQAILENLPRWEPRGYSPS